MKKNIATISNNVLTSCYDLSMVELRLIFQFISLINNSEDHRDKVITSDRFYNISAEDFAELYGIKVKLAKEELKYSINSLFDKVFIYFDNKGKKVKTRWVSSIRYDVDKDQVELAWAVGIIPHISNLQVNFTSCKMRYIAELPSAYSFRWYTIFLMELNKNARSMYYKNLKAKEENKAECNILEVEYTIKEIRNMFVLDDKYNVLADLRKRVIERPIQAMMESKQCNVGVKGIEYIREGKAVVSVKFFIMFTISAGQEKLAEQIELYKKQRQLKFGDAGAVSME